MSTLLYINETLDDYEALSALMLSTVPIAKFDLLSMIIDTTTLHFQAFRRLDSLEALQNSCIQRYRSLRRLYPAQKSLVHSLRAFAGLSRNGQDLSKFLEAELTSCDQTSAAAAACTPASEGILNESQGTPAEKDDEIERILTSGTIMDGSMICKVFEATTERILETASEKGNPDSTVQQSLLLTRLRVYDEARFDLLMMSWIERVAASKQSSELSSIAPFLVGSDCIDLLHLITHAKTLFASHQSSSQGSTCFSLWLLEVFALDLSKTCSLTGSDRLLGDCGARVDSTVRHFMVKQSTGLEKHFMDLVDILCEFLKSVVSANVINFWSRIKKVFASEIGLHMVMKAVFTAPADTFWKIQGVITASETRIITTELESLIRRLMDPSGSLGLWPLDLHFGASVLICLGLVHQTYSEALSSIFTNVDDFSEPFLRVGLSLLVQSVCLDGDKVSIKKQLSIAVKTAIDRGCSHWSSLLSLLPTDMSPALDVGLAWS